MPAKRSNTADFNQRRIKEGWTRVAAYTDFQWFSNFVIYSGNANHQRFGLYAMEQVKKFYPEVERTFPDALG